MSQWKPLTETRAKVIRHLLEFSFLYHKTDDYGKFSHNTLRAMARDEQIVLLRAGIDHDEDCYEISAEFYAELDAELSEG